MSEKAAPQPDKPLKPAGDLAAFAGCWVAFVAGQVAGVGRSAEAARLAARQSRPRERIQAVRYVAPLPAGQDDWL